ncbi:macro domain-containing protein [Corynebacterium rouxii]|uniref:macro domain-containing protein n=1 Tax=Corynebacterium rouxii TaxID=2719119 RepID=UPI00313ACF23
MTNSPTDAQITAARNFLHALEADDPRNAVVVSEGIDDSFQHTLSSIDAMVNMRDPRAASQELQEAQSAFLKATTPAATVVVGDITELPFSAMVAPAAQTLIGPTSPSISDLSARVHQRAGFELRRECARLLADAHGQVDISSTHVTSGFLLPAHWIIHAVTPQLNFTEREASIELLRQCFRNVFALVREKGWKELSIPSNLTGPLGFPTGMEAQVLGEELATAKAAGLSAHIVIVCDSEDEAAAYRRVFTPEA